MGLPAAAAAGIPLPGEANTTNSTTLTPALVAQTIWGLGRFVATQIGRVGTYTVWWAVEGVRWSVPVLLECDWSDSFIPWLVLVAVLGVGPAIQVVDRQVVQFWAMERWRVTNDNTILPQWDAIHRHLTQRQRSRGALGLIHVLYYTGIAFHSWACVLSLPSLVVGGAFKAARYGVWRVVEALMAPAPRGDPPVGLPRPAWQENLPVRNEDLMMHTREWNGDRGAAPAQSPSTPMHTPLYQRDLATTAGLPVMTPYPTRTAATEARGVFQEERTTWQDLPNDERSLYAFTGLLKALPSADHKRVRRAMEDIASGVSRQLGGKAITLGDFKRAPGQQDDEQDVVMQQALNVLYVLAMEVRSQADTWPELLLGEVNTLWVKSLRAMCTGDFVALPNSLTTSAPMSRVIQDIARILGYPSDQEDRLWATMRRFGRVSSPKRGQQPVELSLTDFVARWMILYQALLQHVVRADDSEAAETLLAGTMMPGITLYAAKERARAGHNFTTLATMLVYLDQFAKLPNDRRNALANEELSKRTNLVVEFRSLNVRARVLGVNNTGRANHWTGRHWSKWVTGSCVPCGVEPA